MLFLYNVFSIDTKEATPVLLSPPKAVFPLGIILFSLIIGTAPLQSGTVSK